MISCWFDFYHDDMGKQAGIYMCVDDVCSLAIFFDSRVSYMLSDVGPQTKNVSEVSYVYRQESLLS